MGCPGSGSSCGCLSGISDGCYFSIPERLLVAGQVACRPPQIIAAAPWPARVHRTDESSRGASRLFRTRPRGHPAPSGRRHSEAIRGSCRGHRVDAASSATLRRGGEGMLPTHGTIASYDQRPNSRARGVADASAARASSRRGRKSSEPTEIRARMSPWRGACFGLTCRPLGRLARARPAELIERTER